MTRLTIREQIDAARVEEHVTMTQLALLTGFSERTLWRRLKAGFFPHVLQSGRVLRIHRASAIRALRRPESHPR